MAIQLVVQLVSIPVLTHHWGVERYGIWVMLFTVPQFIAMADLGLTTVGANVMIEAVARGDDVRAARVYRALRAFGLASGAILLAIAALVIGVLRPEALQFHGHLLPQEGPRAAAFLCVYGVVALLNGVTLAAYRAADRFAWSGFIYANIALVEAGAAFTVAARGGDLTAVALAYLLARLAGTVVLSGLLRRLAPWIRGSWRRADAAELRQLLRPAISAMLYPAGNAVALQGAVMAIGAVGGPAAVPAFTVVRTFTRTALQFSYRFTVASMPRYTAHVARGDTARARQLVALNLAVAGGLILPAAALMLVFGLPVIHLWTGGRIVPSFELLALMVAAMALNAAWAPLSNLLLAVNRHEGFVRAFLVFSLAAVGLGAALTIKWQSEGMAAAMMLLEIAMIGVVWREGRRHEITGGKQLRKSIMVLIRQLRDRAHSRKGTA